MIWVTRVYKHEERARHLSDVVSLFSGRSLQWPVEQREKRGLGLISEVDCTPYVHVECNQSQNSHTGTSFPTIESLFFFYNRGIEITAHCWPLPHTSLHDTRLRKHAVSGVHG